MTRFPANESPRRTGSHSSLSEKSSFQFLPPCISRSCRTASGVSRLCPRWVLSSPSSLAPTIEIDTLEYQQTEKIETELKDVDRIRANRCTQLCPGFPSGASHSHSTIYYSFPADSPPSRKEAPRWRVLYRINRQLLHRARGQMREF